MFNGKKSSYKNGTISTIVGIFLSWVIIFLIWVSYPKYLINQDNSLSQELPDNIWKGVPFQYPEKEEITGRSYNFALGEKYGTYGDMYGSLNTLFSGLAFSTLIISIFLQMLELRATRKELSEQKNALIDQKKEFSSQTSILNQQKIISQNQLEIVKHQLIESKKQNLSNMLSLLFEERKLRINSFKIYAITNQSKDIDGPQVLTSYGLYFLRKISSLQRNCTTDDILKTFEVNKETSGDIRNQFYNHWIYYESYETRNYTLGNYFTIIISMFDLIESHKDALGYSYESHIQMIKRTFQQYELLVFFWFSLGCPKYDKYIYKYEIFDTLIYIDGLGAIAKHVFEQKAFGNHAYFSNIFEDQNTA